MVDGNGLPIDFKLTGGEVHDVQEAIGLLSGKTAKYVIGDAVFVEVIDAIVWIFLLTTNHHRHGYTFGLM